MSEEKRRSGRQSFRSEDKRRKDQRKILEMILRKGKGQISTQIDEIAELLGLEDGGEEGKGKGKKAKQKQTEKVNSKEKVSKKETGSKKEKKGESSQQSKTYIREIVCGTY